MAKHPKSVHFHPPLIITAHGIRTEGRWQKDFAAIASQARLSIDNYDYGNYGLCQFINRFANNKKIDEFYSRYSEMVNRCRDVDVKRHDKRPSLVAHSFGSWIAGYAMLKYENIRFDKIIFIGSILPRDFDWPTLFARDQVARVLNECDQKDPWPWWASRIIARAGTGGSDGFDWFTSTVENVRRDEFHHSDALRREHMQAHWLPFLLRPPTALSLLNGRNVDDLNYFSDLLSQSRNEIDTEAYSHISHYKDEKLPAGLSLTWIGINPDIYTFLIDRKTDKVAGYVNAMPVTDELYDQIRNGQHHDNQVSAKQILPFQANRPLKIYLMSIAVLKQHRRWGEGLFHQATVKLFAGFLDKLSYYAKTHSVFVCKIVAVAWTDEGSRMCELFHMKAVGKNKHNESIYELDIVEKLNHPAQPMPHALKRLVAVYRELFPHPN